MRGWWRVVWVVGATSALCAGCKPPEEGASAEAPPVVEERVPRVEAVTLSTVPFSSYLRLTGETEAVETVTVSAELPGRVVAANFEEGQEVRAGQWLVRVDARVDRTRAGQLQTSLEQARRDLTRTKELMGKGLSTASEMERAELNVKMNEYNLTMTRQGVGKSSVSSPIDGVVERQGLREGEYANPGVPVATIVRYDKIKVEAGVPESLIRYAKVGDKVKVWIPALEMEREGSLQRVAVQANAKNRTFPVEVEIPNEDKKIRAGMRAELRLLTGSWEAALLVPRDALVERLEGRVVFVLAGDKVSQRAVRLGGERGALVQVVEGLQAGDEVVVVGQRDLSDGDLVKVVKREACCAAQLEQAQQAMAGGER
jgi:RND family efflux transporter MFP subunit